MKGLLIKDIRVTLQNKKMMGVLLFVAIALLTMQGAGSGTFIVSYMTIMCGMLVLTTISVDEFDKSSTFLMTMPIDRKTYAAEKYVFAIMCSLCGWVVSTIPCVLMQTELKMEFFKQALVLFIVISLLQLIILPVQLKFGGEKGRMVLLGIFGAIFIIALLVKKISENMFATQAEAERWLVEVLGKIESMSGLTIGIAALVIWLLCLGISFMISKKIMENKEY